MCHITNQLFLKHPRFFTEYDKNIACARDIDIAKRCCLFFDFGRGIISAIDDDSF